MLLYHLIDQPIRGNALYSLYDLKDRYPDLFEIYLKKYTERNRVFILDVPVPHLECRWSDCVFLSAIHPQQITEALHTVTGQRQPFGYFEIPITNLATEKLVRYSGRGFNDKQPEDFRPFNPEMIEAGSSLPEKTVRYYQSEVAAGKRPLYWAFSPQFLYRNSVDLSDYTALTTK